jgi:hypothetical protein
MKFLFSFFLICIATANAFADGGTVQISREEGPFRITVFTTAAIVRAGPEDISVLVQDRGTQQPILDAVVWLSFQRVDQKPVAEGEAWTPPCCRMKSGGAGSIKATHEMATNKLLYAATTVLPEAGEWEVQTKVQTSNATATVTGRLRVDPPAPTLLAYWPFFILPVVSIAGYVLHANLRKKNLPKVLILKKFK